MSKLLAVCAGALLFAACGPVQSMTVIWEANSEIEGARAAEARKYAPYEIVAAEAYLDKALEEQSYADFEPAIDFATKARDLAIKAKQMSERATSKAPPPTAPQAAPSAESADPAPVKVVPVPEGTESDAAPSAQPVVVPVTE